MFSLTRISSALLDVKGRLIVGVLALTSLACTASAGGAVDTRSLSAHPKEVYGGLSAPIRIRLGNGGAGPTGILRALAVDYLAARHETSAIAWYQDISPNTLRQLKLGIIDIALVYERRQEISAQRAGYATRDTLIFNDHFLIAGPRTNPAAVLATDTPVIALQKIARLGERRHAAVFLSRDDHSATNEKEKSIWRAAGLTPWRQAVWYRKKHVFPQPALLAADRDGLYSISDHGTWLNSMTKVTRSRVFNMGGALLRNPCHALLGKKPSAAALQFLAYLKSARAQALIANYGKQRFAGQAYFTKAAQLDFAANTVSL